MKSLLLSLITLLCFSFLFSQNVGIGTNTPTQKLDVNGNVRAIVVIAGSVSAGVTSTNGLVINSGGTQNDFLIKGDPSGQVGFRKGHGALGLNYIIAVGGFFPQITGSNHYDTTLLGEIKLFAGNFPPSGWMFCQGQLLSTTTYEALFYLIGTSYGGDGNTHFGLPDLRGSVPVQQSTSAPSPGIFTWDIGEKNF